MATRSGKQAKYCQVKRVSFGEKHDIVFSFGLHHDYELFTGNFVFAD
jgi:hypothetical protein